MSTPLSEPASGRPRMRIRWGLLLPGLLIAAVIIAGSLIVFPPSGFISGEIRKAIKDATGRDLDIGSASYVLTKDPVEVELRDVRVSGTPGVGTGPLLKAKTLKTTVPRQDVLDRKFNIKEVTVDGLELNLVRDAQGRTNWTSDGGAGPGSVLALPITHITNGTVSYSDAVRTSALVFDQINTRLAIDEKYGGAAAKGTARFKEEPLSFDIAVADVKAALEGKMTGLGLMIESKHLNAKLSGSAAIGDEPLLAGEIEATSPSARDLAGWLGFPDAVPDDLGSISFKGTSDPKNRRAAGVGKVQMRGEIIDYDMAVNDIAGVISGKPTLIDGTLASKHVTAKVKGQATVGAAKSFAGDIEAKSPAFGALVKWLGYSNADIEKLGPGFIKGNAQLGGNVVTLQNTEFDVDGRTGKFTGKIDNSKQRPAISGTLDPPRVDLAVLFPAPKPTPGAAPEAMPAEDETPQFESTWDVLAAELKELEDSESAPSAAPKPVLEAAKKPAKPVWSVEPIDLKALNTVDLDLTVNAGELAFGDLDLKKGRIRTNLTDGKLAAKIEELGVGKGSARGSVDIDSKSNPVKSRVDLTMTGVEAQPITKQLIGKELLIGPANVTLSTTATGQNIDQLVRTLDGNAKFDMGKGALKGWDVQRMINQFWNYGSWGFNPERKTNFEKLTANYTIKSGILKSAPDLSITGPEAKVKSRGDVQLPTKNLNQTITVAEVPIPFVIKGDWTKTLWVGPSFFSSPSSGPTSISMGLEAVSQLGRVLPPPTGVPAHIQAAIERVLAKGLPSDKLPNHTKLLLKSLITPGGATSSPAP